MYYKSSINKLLINSLLLAVYICFFSVQLVFGLEAVIKNDATVFQISQSGIPSNNIIVLKRIPVQGVGKYNIRLNKRFEPTSTPAIVVSSIEIPFYYFVLPTIVSYTDHMIPSSYAGNYTLRGPPNVV